MADTAQKAAAGFSVTIAVGKVTEFAKLLLGYFALPIALPLIFLQECLAWFRKRTGLSDRSLEGKVRTHLIFSINTFTS